MLETATTVFGQEWSQARSKLKKAELVEAMTDAFALRKEPMTGTNEEQQAASQSWIPAGFAPDPSND